MSTGTRVSLLEAELVANELATALGDGCLRIEVGGSIRRRSPDVGDIEIVAVPRVHTERVREGLFEDRDLTVDELQVMIDLLLLDGTLMAHPDDPKRGPRYSKLMHVASRIQVDIFSCTLDTFGMALAIRTGPAQFSQWLVNEARARGYHVANGYELHKGRLSCNAIPCLVLPTREEGDVWTHLHLHPLRPESRA